MRYIECPSLESIDPNEKSLFLAGGISNCPNWQLEVVNMLKDSDWTIINPRRANFDVGNNQLLEPQIEWEHQRLRQARAILFWFPAQTLCPITLNELGAWSMMNKPLFVGTHPEYQRKYDVEIQTRLVRPEITIQDSLEKLVLQITNGGGL